MITNRAEAVVRSLIRNNRKSVIMRSSARLAERYLNAWYNSGHYDFATNGEGLVLEKLREASEGEVFNIWDVGAHEGDYALEAHRILPNAHVTCFEILPPIAERIGARRFDLSWFSLQVKGLSNEAGLRHVTWNRTYDTTNSISPRLDTEWFSSSDLLQIECEVTTIDKLVHEGFTPPNFLKIDVEGHEAAVLDGATDLLRSDYAPILIQFEYGDTWIPESKTLFEVQSKLQNSGYSVGRLYPQGVHFKNYHFSDEKFRMGNMIAVRDERLQRLLTA